MGTSDCFLSRRDACLAMEVLRLGRWADGEVELGQSVIFRDGLMGERNSIIVRRRNMRPLNDQNFVRVHFERSAPIKRILAILDAVSRLYFVRFYNENSAIIRPFKKLNDKMSLRFQVGRMNELNAIEGRVRRRRH